MNLWGVVREFSPGAVAAQANAPFTLGITGTADAIAQAARRVRGESTEPANDCGPPLLCLPTPLSDSEMARLARCSSVVTIGNDWIAQELRPVPVIAIPTPDRIIEAVAATRPPWELAAARSLPGFREPVADLVINDVCKANLQFALIASVPEGIPFLAPLFPALHGTDVLVLTKNQMLLVLRLAAIYGKPLNLKERVKELLPVVGGAFGWRAGARQLAGMVPGGFGFAIKGGIAWSGTYVVGKAAQHMYRHGRPPSADAMRDLYAEARERASEAVKQATDKVRRKPEEAKTPPAPEPSGPPDGTPPPTS